jgi:cyclopropane fatty-acyl-phospholipid synthase-like methyltransferase
MDKTIEYYNTNAREYFEKTFTAEMSPIYEHFIKFLKPGSHICDLGCGSGRDSKYFISQGFTVMPIDGSLEICKLASNFLNQNVICQKFDEIDYKNEFDAIWACASLLHVKKNKLSYIIEKLIQAARDNAVIYTCFKIGNSERIKDGRLFADYNQNEMLNFIKKYESLRLLETWLSNDVINPIENFQWLNIIVKIIK